jgi:hypothetical protein
MHRTRLQKRKKKKEKRKRLTDFSVFLCLSFPVSLASDARASAARYPFVTQNGISWAKPLRCQARTPESKSGVQPTSHGRTITTVGNSTGTIKAAKLYGVGVGTVQRIARATARAM